MKFIAMMGSCIGSPWNFACSPSEPTSRGAPTIRPGSCAAPAIPGRNTFPRASRLGPACRHIERRGHAEFGGVAHRRRHGLPRGGGTQVGVVAVVAESHPDRHVEPGNHVGPMI